MHSLNENASTQTHRGTCYFLKYAMFCYLKFASTDWNTILKNTPGRQEDRDKIGQGIKAPNLHATKIYQQDWCIPKNDISRCVHRIQILWCGVILEIYVMNCLKIWRLAIDELDDKDRQTHYSIWDKLKPSSIFLMLRKSYSIQLDKLVKDLKRDVILKQTTFYSSICEHMIILFFFSFLPQ